MHRLRQRTRHVVTEGLMILFRGQYPACEATLDAIQIKKGLQVKLSIGKGSRNWHEVVDAIGQQVLIVVADPESYLARMDEVKARADQGDLFTGDYKPNETYRRDQPAPPIDQSWQDLIDSLEEPKDDGELRFGAAADEPAPPPKSMGQQVHEFLCAIHVRIDLDTCEKWTEQECTVAAYWAIEYAKDPDKAPARPHWLPIPNPPDHAVAQGEQTEIADADVDSADADQPTEDQTDETEPA